MKSSQAGHHPRTDHNEGHPAAAFSSPSIKHMRSLNQSHDAAAAFHHPQPHRGQLPTSLSKSICTLAMKMVNDDTIRARVADMIPSEFFLVDSPSSGHFRDRLTDRACGASLPDSPTSTSDWITILTPSSEEGPAFPTIADSNTPNPKKADVDVAPSPQPHRVFLRRNVSSLLEMSLSLRASPVMPPSKEQPAAPTHNLRRRVVLGNTSNVPGSQVISLANVSGDLPDEATTPSNSTPRSPVTVNGESDLSDSIDPDLLSSRMSRTSSAESRSNTPKSTTQFGGWFESLFDMMLRAPLQQGTAARTDSSTNDQLEHSSNQNDEGVLVTPFNPLEKQFIVAAAYVLNAAIIAGLKSADYLLRSQPPSKRMKGNANEIVQEFVEMAIDVIEQAWFSIHTASM